MKVARNICFVYGNEVLRIWRWLGQFPTGNVSLANSAQSRRPSSVNIELLKTVVVENSEQTVRELIKQFNSNQKKNA